MKRISSQRGREKIKTGGMVRSKTVGGYISDFVLVFIIAVCAAICIIPMWHILMLSVSDGRTIYTFDGIAMLPQGGVTFAAYLELFSTMDGILWRGYLNTVIYVVGTLAFGLIINVVAGYCLSRKTKLRGFMSVLCIFSVMFSGGQAPLYFIVSSLNLTNTYFSVIFTECTMGMYMLYGAIAFRSVPKETVEAAELDGSGHIRVMFQIMLPQCLSIFMVTLLMTFVSSWNSYISAQLYNTRNSDIHPLQLVLLTLKEEVDGWMNSSADPPYASYPMQFAGIIMATLPIMIAMPFFQDKLEAGVIGGAVKG